MKPFLSKLVGRASDLAQTQPLPTLFLAGALLAVFLAALVQQSKSADDSCGHPTSLRWAVYRQLGRLLWALCLVVFAVGALSVLRSYLHQTVANFQRTHGRITEANYNAVQTIWGGEQDQGDLRMEIYYEEEITERIESEDLTKPAVLRKRTVRHFAPGNPFLSARHAVTLRQNPRKKGSAVYGGYETSCKFTWRLKNPADREMKCNLKFPLPAAGAVYDDLSATLNGADVLPQMEVKEAALALARDLKPGEMLDLDLAFKSRGMSYWYFQVKEAREIRDFTFVLDLPDLPNARLNYPEGCMSPTSIQPTPDGQGSVLTYRLDHALSNKGMGIALPKLPQPGATTNAVLSEMERGWLLSFAMLLLGLTLAGVNHAVLISVLFAAANAFASGLLADLSDFLFGFWGTALFIVVPLLLVLAWLLSRIFPGSPTTFLAMQLVIYGIVYPTVAGLDADRQTLYLNVCGLVFLSITAWQLIRKRRSQSTEAFVPDRSTGS